MADQSRSQITNLVGLSAVAPARWHAPFVVIDVDFKVIHSEPAAEQYLQLSPRGGAIGGDLRVRDELSADLNPAIRRAFATGEPTLLPPVAIPIGTETRYVAVHVRPDIRPNATPSCCIIFIDAGAQPPPVCDQTLRAVEQDARRKVAESEERLRLANEAGGIGTFSIDAKTGLAHYSPELAALIGYPGAEVVKVEQAFQRIHRDDFGRILKLFNAAQDPSGDGLLSMEFRFVRPGGEIRWMIWNGCFQFADTPNGRTAERVFGVCLDITNRKTAEEALRISEARYRSVVEGSLQGIGIHQNGQIVYANSAMARIFGYASADDLIGKSAFEAFVAPEEREHLRARTSAVYAGQEVKPHPGWRGFRRDGQEIYVSATAHIAEWQGRPAVVSFYLDITERKVAERRLAENHRLMKLACIAGRMGTWHFDFTTLEPDISDEGLELIGIEKAHWKKSLEQLLAMVHPDDQKKWRQVVDSAIANKSDIELEYRVVKPDHKISWLLVRGVVHQAANGMDYEGLGVILDITDRKNAEERQQMLLRELDHRVKNSLTNLHIVMQRSHEQSKTLDEFKEALENRLMSMSVTHTRLSKAGWVGVSVTDIVKDALAPFSNDHNTKTKGPNVILKPSASQPLAMVLCELATNAAKYGALSQSPSGTAQAGQVLVSWRVETEKTRTAFPKSLVITWAEDGRSDIQAPTRTGYGTSVIRDLIPYELKGSKCEFEIAATGARCRIEIPARFIVMHAGPATAPPP